jgi:hypothetical protein
MLAETLQTVFSGSKQMQYEGLLCPNMAIMAVENPSQVKQASSMNNAIAGKSASLY